MKIEDNLNAVANCNKECLECVNFFVDCFECPVCEYFSKECSKCHEYMKAKREENTDDKD